MYRATISHGVGRVLRWRPVNLGQAEAEGAVSTGFEAGARATLPAWSVGVAAGAGLLLGVLFGRAMK